MSYLRSYKEKNGDYWVEMIIYKCDNCGEEMHESWPRVDIENKNYCGDCAFRLGLISEQKYIDDFCFWCPAERAGINPETGKIELLDNKKSKFSWQRPLKDYRHTKQYSDWRKAVFERDSFTCQDCGQHGGRLEAHHIKTFKNYPKLRFDIDNGVTLCRACHLKRHKRGEKRLKTHIISLTTATPGTMKNVST